MSSRSAQRPRGAETHRASQSYDATQSSATVDQSASEMERPQEKERAHTEEKSKAERDQVPENQVAGMMVALTACLVEPGAVQDVTEHSADDAQPPAAQLVAQSAPAMPASLAGMTMQQAAPEANMNGHRPMVETGQGNGNQPQSTGAKTEPLPSGPVPAGEQAGETNRAYAQLAADASTLASLPSSSGETVSPDQSGRSLSQVPLPGEAPSIRNLRAGAEDRQMGDHSVAGLTGENPVSSDLSRASQGQEYAMGERDDRAADGKLEPRGAGQSHGHGESGFGETVAALGGDKPALSEGGAGKTGSSLATGRMGATSEASQSEVRPSVMQSVSLYLEPADLGPVNVRIFMMDRTVHAHIRTEHMDLGQGMLSQQQQLETKLQNSGLEMGQFKVTVDQQQLSRGDSHGWLRQEPAWHPAGDEANMRGTEQGGREPIAMDPRPRLGIVSIFA
ncbi:flagellar hook-length control protein FliK [Nitrospira sp. Nam80]